MIDVESSFEFVVGSVGSLTNGNSSSNRTELRRRGKNGISLVSSILFRCGTGSVCVSRSTG